MKHLKLFENLTEKYTKLSYSDFCKDVVNNTYSHYGKEYDKDWIEEKWTPFTPGEVKKMMRLFKSNDNLKFIWQFKLDIPTYAYIKEACFEILQIVINKWLNNFYNTKFLIRPFFKLIFTISM